MQGLIALLMVRMILQNPPKLVAPVSVTIAASQRIAPASLCRTRRDKLGRCRSSPQRTRAGAPSQIAYALRTLKDRPCSICLLHSRLVLGKAISPPQRGGWSFVMFCFFETSHDPCRGLKINRYADSRPHSNHVRTAVLTSSHFRTLECQDGRESGHDKRALVARRHEKGRRRTNPSNKFGDLVP